MSARLFFSAFIAVLCTTSAINEEMSGVTETIPTTAGLLRGKPTMVLNKRVNLFLGVPYAQPPVGNLRFKHPVALEAAHVERLSTNFAPSCNQPRHLESVINPLLKPNRASIAEDCLYLNIYVPESQNDSLPVMVWLAGEGFDFADPQQFDASYLAAEGNVIVVTVNYRLSVFGFLTTLSEEAPGNAGLYDQRMALKWVKSNIEKFGGDSESITLFGRFTGSMSAAIHTFSPLSMEENLFNRVIFQSGVPVGDWVFDRNPLNTTYELAQATNCLYSEMSKIAKCLREYPAEELLKKAISLPFRFRPIYDFHLIHENAISAASKSNYAPVDVMVGINNDEGSICTIALNAFESPFYHKILHNNLTRTDFSELIQKYVGDFFRGENDVLSMLAEYQYNRNGEEKYRRKFLNFCADIFIVSRIQRLADILGEKNGSVYFYEMKHRPSFSIQPHFIRAGHGDDVLYAFALPLQIEDLSDEERKLTRELVHGIVNFASSGNPNPMEGHSKWPRYTSDRKEVMNFVTHQDPPGPRSAVRTVHDDSAEFWNTVVPTVKSSQCQLPPRSALLTSEMQNTELNKEENTFLGIHMALPTIGYMVLGLIGSTCLLLVLFLVTLNKLVSEKKSSFRRLQ
ncbi:carboxylesterase 5A [Nephila pilipes]|uniref:Carboxylesterase 5A n=1 Tax=Nephila pilipes TaxID=299642 RepID=A0A8X6PYS1_NEPPI|nr:carboxylesterase 5A [Nephila pilipes]